MKTILVTGGAGFIGRHLCERLLNQGNRVICLDNFLTGSLRNIEAFQGSSQFELVEHDVCDPFEAEIDEIYHLASPASLPTTLSHPLRTLRINIFGAINMLELAKKTGAKVLVASSSEIYGDPLDHPQKESDWGHVNPVGVRSCYDEGKRVSETLSIDYHREHGVKVKVVRIFNTYGPYMQREDGRVVSNFIVEALENKPLTVYGDGSQTRSFCYVDDLVAGLMAMMDSEDSFLGPVNLGNPEEMTVYSCAQKVYAKLFPEQNVDDHLKYCPQPSDDPQKRQPDITLAKKRLNWSPQVSFDEGLTKTLAYFQSTT